MYKRILTLMLALVMVVSLLPTTAFTVTASGVAEPLADENVSDGSLSPDDVQSSGDETTADGSPSYDDAQSSENVTTDVDSANTDHNRFEGLTGAEVIEMFSLPMEELRSFYSGITEEEWDTISSTLSEDENAVLNSLLTEAGCIAAPQDTDEPPEDGEADDSDMGIAPIALEPDEAVMKEFFTQYAGEYILPDGEE